MKACGLRSSLLINSIHVFLLLTAYCSTLSNPANGRVTQTGITYGQRATYTCNTGYYREGSSTRTCLSTGAWSGSVPSCRCMLLFLYMHACAWWVGGRHFGSVHSSV